MCSLLLLAVICTNIFEGLQSPRSMLSVIPALPNLKFVIDLGKQEQPYFLVEMMKQGSEKVTNLPSHTLSKNRARI